MRTFGTETDNLILEEYHAGINRYNVILYHNGKKIDPYIKKLTAHFMGNSVPFGNISKHYFELNTDYMDFLEKDEVEVRIEKNGVEIKVCTFYIKTINKGEYMASYTAFSSLLEPEKIALYKIDEDPEWRVAWNNSAKTIKEILDIFLKPANLAMAEYPSYDGTFVSLHEDWENMTLSQLICACGILEGCNYVLIGNTFYPVRPSKAVAKSYDIGECVYSENLWQRKTDLCCGRLDVGIKVWEYENYTSEDPLMGSVVSFMESSIEYNNPSSGTGVISANFPLIPGENSSKIKEYMISKLSPFIGMDMNSYTIEYLGDAFIEPGDKVKFYDDSRLVQFYPSEIIWEWDGGLRCTLKSEIVQESGTTEAEVSLKEIVNTINSVANTLQNVRYNSVTTKTLEADAANIGLLKAEQADIKYATIQSLNATDAKITALDSATIKTDELYSKVADLDYIKSDHADIAVIKNTMITTDTLKAEIAKIGYLTADEADIRYLTVSTADTKYLHADMSDMDIAKIQTLFATAGIVSDMTIKDGHITGVLDSVTVNANSITTGTLSVDRLVIRGSEKSLVYELNNISGALQAKRVDTLNGEILTQRTITADKLVAKSITSNEIKTGTITSDEIKTGTITAANINMIDLVGDSAFINSLKTNTVIVGLQNDINGISVGGRNLLIYSQLKLGSLGNGNIENVNYRVVTDNKIPVEPGEQYILKVSNYWKYKGIRYGIHSYNANGNFVNDSGWIQSVGNNPYVFTTRDDTTSIRIVISFSETSASPTTTPVTENRNAVDLETWKNNVKIKLEKGNRATDWTPAPEDVDSLISAAQSTANSANTLAGTANSAAGAAQTTANTALTTANNAKKISYASALGNGNSAGYFKLCTITTNMLYQNIDIVIGVLNRGLGRQTARILFDGQSDASLAKFTLDARLGDWYIHKSATYTWDVYVQKSESWGWLVVDEFVNPTGFQVKWVCENANLPSGATKATRTVAMGTWCYNNDITYINGGKIYTGTVTADKLAANSVTADKILAGAITADKLAVDAITSRNYVKDTSGTKISLADGSYDSKYTKINSEGKIECSNIAITGGSIEFKGSTIDDTLIALIYESNVSDEPNSLSVYPAGIDIKYSSSANMSSYFTSYSYSGVTIDAGPKAIMTADRQGSSVELYSSVTNRSILLDGGSGTIVVDGDVSTSSGISLVNLWNNVSTYYQPFGSSGASLKSGQNLNEFYSGVILGAGMGNAPNDGWWLIVSGGTGGTVTQRAYSLWDGLCYWRYCAAGNWSGWNSTINGTDISMSGSITSRQITCTNLASNSAESTTSKPNVFAYNAGRLIRSTNTSSRRFKDDIKPLENDDLNPDKLYDIGIYQFKYRQDYLSNQKDTRYRKDLIGFIAEEIFEKYPIAADYEIDKDGKVVVNAWNEQYLIPAMLKLIQDQHMQLINQEMKIKILEDKVMFM